MTFSTDIVSADLIPNKGKRARCRHVECPHGPLVVEVIQSRITQGRACIGGRMNLFAQTSPTRTARISTPTSGRASTRHYGLRLASPKVTNSNSSCAVSTDAADRRGFMNHSRRFRDRFAILCVRRSTVYGPVIPIESDFHIGN